MNIKDAINMAKSKAKALQNIKEEAKIQGGYVMQMLEVSGTALALSAIDGYRGKEMMIGGADGVDSALVIGGLAHVGAFVMGGSEAAHIHSIGNGAWAKAAVRFGKKIGEKMAEKSDKTSGDDDSRQLGEGGSRGGYQESFSRGVRAVR